MIEDIESDPEAARLEAIEARDADGLGEWRDAYEPGTLGCHEALHTTAVLLNIVANELLDHGAVIQKPEWYRLAFQAHSALFDLYHAIGVEHLLGGLPEDVSKALLAEAETAPTKKKKMTRKPKR